MSGRAHEKRMVAVLAAAEGDAPARLCSPGVGLFRTTSSGKLVRPGAVVGELEVLSELFLVVAPQGAGGLCRDPEEEQIARRPVAYGDVLFTLDTDLVAEEAAAAVAESGATSGTVFASPTSGRYYAKPSPDAPPFVKVGDVIAAGQTVALLEVMKTFNRVQYGGGALPERAKVLRIVPKDEEDLSAGDPILELESAD